MNISPKTFFFAIFNLLLISQLAAQVNISGRIIDENKLPLEGALIELAPINIHTISNKDGYFDFEDLAVGDYHLIVSFLGFETLKKEVLLSREKPSFEQDFILSSDPLELSSIIVTGRFSERSKLGSSVAISTLSSSDIQSKVPKGTADLLRNIPGTFADASTGEVFTRVYSRGISISAEDDLGWYYVSLQEDGLPVSATQHTFYSPDLFHRTDLTTQRLEAIRVVRPLLLIIILRVVFTTSYPKKVVPIRRRACFDICFSK